MKKEERGRETGDRGERERQPVASIQLEDEN